MIPLALSFFTLLFIAVPIGIALAGSTALMVLFDDFLTFGTLFEAFFNFIQKSTLVAIPFFIYAGFLMEKTGLVHGLFNLADALIGWVPGGFAYATLIAAVLFGAISGSSTAMAAAMNVIAYPEMIQRGYRKWMAAGVIASAGGIALLIPPSITLILFGGIIESSLVKLFFAGVIPSIMLAISDAVIIVLVSIFVVKLPAGTFDLRNCWTAFLQALPGGGWLCLGLRCAVQACRISQGLDRRYPPHGGFDCSRILPSGHGRNIPVLSGQHGLAARDRRLGGWVWAFEDRLSFRPHGHPAGAVHVVERDRHFGAHCADLFSGRVGTGRRPDPFAHHDCAVH
jgi:hypothetical protein